jgi:hypothetical protein
MARVMAFLRFVPRLAEDTLVFLMERKGLVAEASGSIEVLFGDCLFFLISDQPRSNRAVDRTDGYFPDLS